MIGYNYRLTATLTVIRSDSPVKPTQKPGETTMKTRTLAALTAMALAATLAACGQQSQTAQQAADKAKESASKAADATKEAADKAAAAAKDAADKAKEAAKK